MLRTKTFWPAFFPALATRLALQVAGSVAATLIASALVANLPRSGAPAAPAELTSGGKFAARAVALADEAPAQGTRPALPVLTQVSFEPFPAAVDVATPAVLVEPAPRPSRPKAHPAPSAAPARAERARLPDAAPRPFLAPAAAPAEAARAEPSRPDLARQDDGLLPRVAASARSAWTFTASTGGSLLSHLIP